MSITMTFEEYELLKAQAAKPDKGMEELEKWNRFIDELDVRPLLLPVLERVPDISMNDKVGTQLFEAYKKFNS